MNTLPLRLGIWYHQKPSRFGLRVKKERNGLVGILLQLFLYEVFISEDFVSRAFSSLAMKVKVNSKTDFSFRRANSRLVVKAVTTATTECHLRSDLELFAFNTAKQHHIQSCVMMMPNTAMTYFIDPLSLSMSRGL